MTPRRPHPRLSVLAVPRSALGPALLRPALGATLATATLLTLSACGAADAGAVSQGELPSNPASSAPASPTESTSTETTPAPPETPAPTETSSEPSEPSGTTSAETEPAEPRLIAYAGGESPGAEIRNQADADKLVRAPAEFRQFIGRTAERLAATSTCTGGYVGVTVQFLRTDGYAVGGVNDCGGYLALWVVVDGSWKEVAGTQEMWDCAVLQRYAVPSAIAGSRCYDYDAQKERRYEQA